MMSEDEKTLETREWKSKLISDFGIFCSSKLFNKEKAREKFDESLKICPWNIDNMSRYSDNLRIFHRNHEGALLLDNLYFKICNIQIINQNNNQYNKYE